MAKDTNGNGEAVKIAIGEVLEDVDACEREQAAGGFPSAFETALFVVRKYGKENAIEIMVALQAKAWRDEKVNAACYYTAVLLDLQGKVIGRIAREELLMTLKRLWLPRQ